jgi:hypothetical protein
VLRNPKRRRRRRAQRQPLEARTSEPVQRTTQLKRGQSMRWRRNKARTALLKLGVVLAKSIHEMTKSYGMTRHGSVERLIQATSTGHRRRRIVCGRLTIDRMSRRSRTKFYGCCLEGYPAKACAQHSIRTSKRRRRRRYPSYPTLNHLREHIWRIYEYRILFTGAQIQITDAGYRSQDDTVSTDTDPRVCLQGGYRLLSGNQV